jgi:hypothetical protein
MGSIYELEKNKPVLFWVGFLLGLEFLSLLAWLYQPLAILFLALIAVALILVYQREKQLLILIPLLELFWGSMGRSLQYDFFSLRWLIFICTILFFIIINLKRLDRLRIFHDKITLRIFLVYFFIIIVVIFFGLFNHHSWRNIFFDANAYFYFLYLPIWLEYYDSKIFKKIINILLVSASVIAVKTIITFFIFTQSNFDLINYYKWIRDTRTGEITKLDNGFNRIFFQSQIYLLLAWSIIFYRSIKDRLTGKKFLFLVVLSTAIYISLSRSLWLGWLVLVISFFCLDRGMIKKLKYLFLIGLGSYILVLFLFNVPNYHQLNLFANRSVSTQEAALSTRTLLLPVMLESIKYSPIIGHGFGQELAFLSNDPRSKNVANPSGQRTSFSFEWGWLDFMLKGGLLLALFFVYSLFYIIRGTYAIMKIQPEFSPFLPFFLALPIIHIFTPYLNHPLGLGLLMLGIINLRNHN